MSKFMSVYGAIPIGRNDIRGKACWSVDMRAITSMGAYSDDTKLIPAGLFALSVFDSGKGEPIGEIRIIYKGREVAIVGHLTGRDGVVEITPDHLTACVEDDDYRQSLCGWLGEAEA